MNVPSEHSKPFTILVADDDRDDWLLIEDAFSEGGSPIQLRFVQDGEELMDYLLHGGDYGGSVSAPRPALILLDLKMPKKSGLEVLREIKATPDLQRIPVVIFTGSADRHNIARSYEAGASSFIFKPTAFDALLDIVKSITEYWFRIVVLPDRN